MKKQEFSLGNREIIESIGKNIGSKNFEDELSKHPYHSSTLAISAVLKWFDETMLYIKSVSKN